MKILAVEFSTDQRSVAVVLSDAAALSSPSPLNGERAGVRGAKVLGEATETATRSTHAFALIEKALRDAHIEREEIDCLAIGLGPGSYTGIRSAIAVAQGWQLARPIKLVGISSAESIAAEAQARGLFGSVNVVIDAQRNELYLARYEITPNDIRVITPLALATPDNVRSRPAENEVVVGPESTRWFDSGKMIYPTAATLGRLAVNRADFVPGEKLEPIYLREVSFAKAAPPRISPEA